MKWTKFFLFSLLVLFSILTFNCNASHKNERVITKGYEPGKWTMDIQAARKYAKEHDLPMFLNFTGSDWCVWCKLMEEKVFSKEEFYDETYDRIVLVWIDFPRDKDLVPEEYRDRNRKLANVFHVRGLPTYIILDSEGNELGRLGATRNPSVNQFLKELFNLIDNQ